jgi:hypothetical protein
MTAAIDARIQAHRRRFDELLARAEAQDAAGASEDAADLSQVAAALAWHSPAGLFASPRLEAGLHAIGRSLSTRADPPAPRAGALGAGLHVLHVLTTAYAVGGHTRLAWRWIERDDRRVHSVALTRQGIEPVPAGLARSVRERGGQIHRVDRADRSLTGRATALCGVIGQADVVVLHTHPFDVVPVLALSALDNAGRRPDTILLNHADHVFWIGSSVSDLVLHLRASGSRLAETRRGLAAERSGILPLPLGHHDVGVDRDAAREALGFKSDDVVAISIASGYKFGGAADDERLLPILERAIADQHNLRVLAVGPGGNADWVEVERTTAGRIRALGNRREIGSIYAAADIYLDSYPFSSLTSMLEAGQRGLPLLSLSAADPQLDVLGFDDPATDGLAIRFRASDAYLQELRDLVADPVRRSECGQRIADALQVHEGLAWQRRLEQAYERATELHAHPQPPTVTEDPPPGTITELDRRLVILLDAQQADAPRGVRGHVRLAPLALRLEEWRRSRHSDRPLSALVLLPEHALLRARRVSLLSRALLRRLRDSR